MLGSYSQHRRMERFMFFQKMPLELRLAVWACVLEDEAKDRLVLFDSSLKRIVPTRSLVSPLQRVNVESRGVALSRYSTRLEIFTVHPQNRVPLVPFKTVDESFESGAGWNDELEHLSDECLQDRREEFSALLNIRVGVVYIDPTHDTFGSYLYTMNQVVKSGAENIVDVPVTSEIGIEITDLVRKQLSVEVFDRWDSYPTRCEHCFHDWINGGCQSFHNTAEFPQIIENGQVELLYAKDYCCDMKKDNESTEEGDEEMMDYDDEEPDDDVVESLLDW
ncbi:hypothetical protein JX266_000224 [Neoarthrinium moseri]|nr:hypothetical protein JX266_000224 [Neoarthrinium moseri]